MLIECVYVYGMLIEFICLLSVYIITILSLYQFVHIIE